MLPVMEEEEQSSADSQNSISCTVMTNFLCDSNSVFSS